MGINNFKKFQLNERVGVAEATLFYTEPIFNMVWNEFLEFYQSEDKKIEDDHVITYSSLKPYITDRFAYSQFPVVGIDVNILFVKMTEQEFSKRYKYALNRDKKLGKTLTHAVGGYASNFGHRNWSGYSRMTNPVKEVSDHGLILNCGVSVDLSPDFNIGLYKNKIQDEIEETIWHELNHLYEYYNRVLIGSGRIETRGPAASITSADVNKWGIPRDIYDFWVYNFTFYLYASEPHELNAQVQEASFWVSKYGFTKLEKTTAWKIADRMQKFDSETFIKALDEEIDKYINSKSQETTAIRQSGVLSHPLRERLKNMWVQQYEKSLKNYSEEPTIALGAVKKMKCEDFVEYFQKRINKSGTYLKKKLSKLYVIKPDEEDIDSEEIY